MKSKLSYYDTAEFLDTDNKITTYLSLVLENGDPYYINQALIDIAKAKQLADIAQKMGITQKSLFQKLLKEKAVDNTFIKKYLKALGLEAVKLPKRNKETNSRVALSSDYVSSEPVIYSAQGRN